MSPPTVQTYNSGLMSLVSFLVVLEIVRERHFDALHPPSWRPFKEHNPLRSSFPPRSISPRLIILAFIPVARILRPLSTIFLLLLLLLLLLLVVITITIIRTRTSTNRTYSYTA
ncbi:hypothetical protein CORC01_04629 [Colletotrichum orchidophilum]|uniref:Uncharacterized protein n=1 Tax=Colletotrichum orchidophilum TaxID=1209926 RepID=A0A1G4BF93_9PEZI|nr:uncharacterized protein CORC01_04629 [Colletotrichum orchidophilum]OHE99982.1 hypothetical protein CORC01_04629 [Colletotrichum orchidophilum]